MDWEENPHKAKSINMNKHDVMLREEPSKKPKGDILLGVLLVLVAIQVVLLIIGFFTFEDKVESVITSILLNSEVIIIE